LCAKWLNECQLLPSAETLDLYKFAECLRDGIVLCNLLEYLSPNSIEYSRIKKNVHFSRILCIKNIELFIDTCKSKPFNLSEKDLFQPAQLYDFGLKPVIQTLSILSNSDAALFCGIKGFQLVEPKVEEEKIYENAFLRSFSTNFVYNSTASINIDESVKRLDSKLASKNNDSTRSVIKKIINNDSSNKLEFISNNNNSAKSVLTTKSNYDIIKNESFEENTKIEKEHEPVLSEIIVSEHNFISLLNCLVNEYLTPLSELLNEKKTFYENFKKILNLHENFFGKLYSAYIQPSGRTLKMCKVFKMFEKIFMKTYAPYLINLNVIVEKLEFLLNNKSKQNGGFQKIFEECKSKCDCKDLSLKDLISLPFYRITKYHIILKELFKKKTGDESTKNKLEETWMSAKAITNYLNECLRDQECIDIIDKLGNTFELTNKINFKDWGKYIKDEKINVKCINNKNGGSLIRAKNLVLFEKELIVLEKKKLKYEIVNNISNYDITSIEDPFMENASSNILDADPSNENNLYIRIKLTDSSKNLELYFKNLSQKNIWKDALASAVPKHRLSNNHTFELFNFDRDIERCEFCNCYLNGIFFQGYKCSSCQVIAHGECLKDSKLCDVNIQATLKFGDFKIFKQNIEKIDSSEEYNYYSKVERLSNISECDSNEALFSRLASRQPKCVALEKYDGNPAPPNKSLESILKFEKGEIIKLNEFNNDADWWIGNKISFNTEDNRYSTDEGYFPRTLVEIIES
jgi:hypothetical protein